MSRSSRKGLEGENKLIDILNDIFKHWGYEWFRTPSQEKVKMARFGDVNLVPKAGNDLCILNDTLFDAQKSKNLTPTSKLKKLLSEKESSGRSNFIYFGEETSGAGTPNFQMVSMDLPTFQYLITMLQSYVENENSEDNDISGPIQGEGDNSKDS